MRIPVDGGVPQPVLESRNPQYYGCARAPASLCFVLEGSPDEKLLTLSAFDPLKSRGKVLRTIAKDSSYCPRTTTLRPKTPAISFLSCTARVPSGMVVKDVKMYEVDAESPRPLSFSPGSSSATFTIPEMKTYAIIAVSW
jgi:hypothetical protein